jgi:hypothetical protein
MTVPPLGTPFAFFNWRLPFSRNQWVVNPWDYSATDQWVPPKKYPIEIKPRGSEIFFNFGKELFPKINDRNPPFDELASTIARTLAARDYAHG